MKKLDCQILVFSWACVIAAGITAFLIGGYVCNMFNEVFHIDIVIVTMCVVAVMLGVILTTLLLMEKQALPEAMHNENILHELLAKMISDSKIKEEYEKKCDDLKAKIDVEIIKKANELEHELKMHLDELKKEIEEKTPNTEQEN
jgi:long-subunit acyl-CoA synthetase (AMP-forming)